MNNIKADNGLHTILKAKGGRKRATTAHMITNTQIQKGPVRIIEQMVLLGKRRTYISILIRVEPDRAHIASFR